MAYTLKLEIPKAQRERIRKQLLERANITRYDRAIGQALAPESRRLIEATPKGQTRFLVEGIGGGTSIRRRAGGFLRKAWAGGFKRLGPLRYAAVNPAPYAIFVEEGTRPHVIRPRVKKLLRWAVGPSVKRDIRFARSVRHPGTKAVLMVKGRLDDIGRSIVTALIRTLQAIR